MTRKMAMVLGVWACLATAGRAQEEHGAPDKPPFPSAWATGPRDGAAVLAAPGEDGLHEGCAGCNACASQGPCWRRLVAWLTNCPGPAHRTCSCCLGCKQCAPCCEPLVYTFFLHRCQGCCGGYPVPGGAAPPRMPEPGDPVPGALAPEVVPGH